MSFFQLKIVLALVFLLTAVSAVTSMLVMMGKTEKKASPKTLRKIHIISGRLFLLLLLPLLFLGMKYWAQMGEQASLRAVFHAVLAWGLITLFMIKVVIIKFFKQFLRFAPVMGLLLFGLVIVVFFISAGYYSVKTLSAKPTLSENVHMASSETARNSENGALFYNKNCLSCHDTDTEDKKVGPGLKGLFDKEKLPYSGLPVTEESIKQQLIRPALVMLSFTKMTEQETADLIAYLKTL